MSVKRIYLIFFLLHAVACTNLKEIHFFSAEAVKGMQQYESLGFGFETQCHEVCLFEAIDNFEIQRDPGCDCLDHGMADSVTLHLYNALHAYWDGLFRLSNNQLTQYDLSATSEAVQTGTFGDISVTSEHVDAYRKIAEVLFRAGTEGAKRKKIKLYLLEANDDVQVLTEKMAFILESNLAGLLELEKERWYSYYSELSFSPSLSEYEKGMAAKAYYELIKDLDQRQKRLRLLATTFRKVAEGHQQLSAKSQQLSGKDLRDWANYYAAELKALGIAYNRLK